MRYTSIIFVAFVGVFLVSAIKKEIKQTSTTAYYKNSSGTCVSVTVSSGSSFKAKGATDCQALAQASNCALVQLYTDATCTTAAAYTN